MQPFSLVLRQDVKWEQKKNYCIRPQTQIMHYFHVNLHNLKSNLFQMKLSFVFWRGDENRCVVNQKKEICNEVDIMRVLVFKAGFDVFFIPAETHV